MRAVKDGGNRLEVDEIVRKAAMQHWVKLDDYERLRKLLDSAEIRVLLDPTHHIGDASELVLSLADKLEALKPLPLE